MGFWKVLEVEKRRKVADVKLGRDPVLGRRGARLLQNRGRLSNLLGAAAL